MDIAVVDASVGDTFAARNFRRVLPAETTVFKASEGELPPAVSPSWPYDGIVISGSQRSVYEDRPWIHQLIDWYQTAHAHRVPTLGVCWGHQFIAHALGGQVVDMGEYELGYRTVTQVAPDPVVDALPQATPVFETHSDRVVALPPGGNAVAINDYGLQAFRVGPAIGVQFHPEYDRETAEWVTEHNDTVSADRIETVLADITDDRVAEAQAATALFDAFTAYIQAFDRAAVQDLTTGHSSDS